MNSSIYSLCQIVKQWNPSTGVSKRRITHSLASLHRRAAYHLTLAVLERRRDPTPTLAWSLLSPAQQADLLSAWYLALQEISAFILRELAAIAGANLGHPVREAVITVPA